jgi:tetratricopeptide (TPR) repeat protein
MGHCHAHEGNLAEALRCYRRALEINPSLEGIQQAIDELQKQLAADTEAQWRVADDPD